MKYITSVYIAGASKEIDALCDLAVSLNSHPRCDVLDDWMHAVQSANAAGIADHEFTVAKQREFARRDLELVRAADVFWLVVPKERGSVGAWIELGHALAHRHLHVVISGDLSRSIFVHVDPRARIFDKHDGAADHIKGFAETR